jgi:hypothetical protein
MPLYVARAARVLHVAAAAFAVGAIAGMFLRGLALEYRASWQSTFLDAPQVHRIVSTALAPGAFVTGIAVPDAAHVSSIRTSNPAGGENASRWLYLYAGTLLVLVIVPRLLLALASGAVERRRAALAIPLDDAYYRRVLRGFREGPISVRVVPYSFTVPEVSVEGLRAVVARMVGPRAQVSIAPIVRYGAEDALPDDLVGTQSSIVVALFTATATPEREGHGAFVAALTARCGGEHECVALVDESAFRDRWPDDEARLGERRAAWRALFDECRIAAAFVDLARPDLPAAEAAIERALVGGGATER